MKFIFILFFFLASLAEASDTYVSKFDLKGNLIKKYFVVADLGVGGDSPWGIETDGKLLYIVVNQAASIGSTTVYVLDKKGNRVRTATAPVTNMYGITTDRRKWMLSSSTPTIVDQDKKFITLRSTAVTKLYLAMTHNGKNIIAAPNGAAALDILDPKSYAIVKTITMGFALAGVTNVHRQLAVIDSGGTALYYYNYAGQQIKGFALAAGTGEAYRDLCHDREFLWIVSSVTPDIDPPKDE